MLISVSCIGHVRQILFSSIASNLRRDFRSRVEKPAVALQAKSCPGWDFVIGSGAGFE